jgi:hypothetical protein
MLKRHEGAERVAEHGIALELEGCRERIHVRRQPGERPRCLGSRIGASLRAEVDEEQPTHCSEIIEVRAEHGVV